jgi:hypothetical protein
MRLTKMSIPKETIKKIMTNRHCFEKGAFKIYFDAEKDIAPVDILF